MHKDITDLIHTILNSYQLKHQLRLTNTYHKRDIFMQYQETDHEFLLRNLSYFGIFYLFHDSTLIISDNINMLPVWRGASGGKLQFQLATAANRPRPTILAAVTVSTLLPQSLQLRDYNYTTPAVLLAATATTNDIIPGYGCSHIYGENSKTPQECERFAKIRYEAIAWRRYIVVFTTDCTALWE